MATPAEAEQPVTPHVLVRTAHLTVVGHPEIATERESSSREVVAEKYVERHVAVVAMHVEAEVLADPIGDDEAVMIQQPLRRLLRKHELRQRLVQLEQCRK